MGNIHARGKIVVIGAGFVGSTVAYTIMMEKLASEIVLIDINKEKATGEAVDMCHGMSYVWRTEVRSGEYSECADADIIVITAGVGRKTGQTRIDLAKINVSIVRDICGNIMKYAVDPVILVISNPVDILTYIVREETRLPASRVIGSGTTLDTGRMRYLISERCGVDARDVNAYIVGEHGDTQVPLWSKTNISGRLFRNFCDECPKKCGKPDLELLHDQTMTAGAQIIAAKGATFFGIAMAAARIVGAVMNDENAVLTVSSVQSGAYGVSDVALSLPSVINRTGICRIIDIEPDPDEMMKLAASAESLKTVLAQVYTNA